MSALGWNEADILENGEDQFRIGLIGTDEDKWRVAILEAGDTNGSMSGNSIVNPERLAMPDKRF